MTPVRWYNVSGEPVPPSEWAPAPGVTCAAGGAWFCTREPGHPAPHVACGSERTGSPLVYAIGYDAPEGPGT